MKYYIVDFDGTVTLSDSLVDVFERFCVSDWLVPENRMLAGEISRTQALFEEVALMKVDEAELYSFLAGHMKIRDGFFEFVERIRRNGDRMMILSGGFRSFIEFILTPHPSFDHSTQAHGSGLPLPRKERLIIPSPFQGEGQDEGCDGLIANDIRYLGDGRWEFVPCPDTLPPLCGTCPNCKRAMVEKIISEGYETIYIGDGETDFCASEHAKVIYATGSLAERLRKKGVEFRRFDTFSEID